MNICRARQDNRNPRNRTKVPKVKTNCEHPLSTGAFMELSVHFLLICHMRAAKPTLDTDPLTLRCVRKQCILLPVSFPGAFLLATTHSQAIENIETTCHLALYA
eukprot:2823839-Amphidinium_carterae.1